MLDIETSSKTAILLSYKTCIRVEDASTPALSRNASLALYDPPGKGTFTVETAVKFLHDTAFLNVLQRGAAGSLGSSLGKRTTLISCY